jgi:hypothetical protein
MSEPIDLSPIADWLDQGSSELQTGIVRRLGNAPATLPGRGLLALEAWVRPVGAAATLVCALAGLVAVLQRESPAPLSLATLLSMVAEGKPPRAADVYIIAGQIGQ